MDDILHIKDFKSKFKKKKKNHWLTSDCDLTLLEFMEKLCVWEESKLKTWGKEIA